MRFSGSVVALVTPMRADGAIDYATLGSLIDWHRAAGTAGLVVAGTTGEAPLLGDDELRDLVRFAVERADGALPVAAGAGTTSTRRSVELARIAFDAGADALLLVTPYYLKTSQSGLISHYGRIAEAVDLPQILYNVPARTGCDLQPATAVRIAQVAPVVAVKEALADMDRIAELAGALPDAVAVLSGDDATCLDALKNGAAGVISVTANIAPKEMARLCALWQQGASAEAESLDRRLQPLHEAMFVEPNPIPVKWAMAQQGIIGGNLRQPLVPLSDQYHEPVLAALREFGVVGKETMSQSNSI